MFFTKQTPPPPLPKSEPNGIEIKVKLSEASLLKLIPVAIALLVSSGVWIQTQSEALPSNDPQRVLPERYQVKSEQQPAN